MSTVHSLFQFEKNIYYKNVHYMYRTRAIITCGLYTFYLIFDGQKPFFKELFFVKFWLYVRLVFKSIVGYSGSCTVYMVSIEKIFFGKRHIKYNSPTVAEGKTFILVFCVLYIDSTKLFTRHKRLGWKFCHLQWSVNSTLVNKL